ncbi:hypothetical protein NUW54_g13355 [Trametes sanguinea]|uniref:Uncharacterized protein n=1 Tax=Trametes sanguinea TaxID=158606 RepID=A0ACC1MMP1_9APHY|nr:hypothetical protein NUW54_g13355 [Trametes sanguinea]
MDAKDAHQTVSLVLLSCSDPAGRPGQASCDADPVQWDRAEEDADDLHVVVHDEDVRAVQEAGVAEDEDELGEVEGDGEDVVRDGDPEERPETRW